MPAFANHIRAHAFKIIHDFDNFEDFEAEMIALASPYRPLTLPLPKTRSIGVCAKGPQPGLGNVKPPLCPTTSLSPELATANTTAKTTC